MGRKYDFIAIDCEKASNEPTSLCSIGIACFKNGRVKDSKEYIIRPHPFEFYSGSIEDGCYHNVPIEVYEKAPTIDQLWPKILKFLKKGILVGHGINGDLQAIQLALSYHGIEYTPPGQDKCICTNIASIYTYPEFESHKLKALCENLDIPINSHHALSDAKAAGYLLLDMLNVTDCSTASDFIDICLEYNQIVTSKYTDRNIEKYELKIKELFNYNDVEIDLVQKNRRVLIDEVISFFTRFKPNFNMPKLNIITCMSPIIEVYNNEKYKNYIDEIEKLNPFSHDGFLYLKTNYDEYTLFFGLLMDKNDLIYNLVLFLNRISSPPVNNNYIGISHKRILKYRQTIYLMSAFLFEEGFEEIDIYKYMAYLYMKQFEYFRSYDFERQYDLMLQHVPESPDIFRRSLKELSKLIGIYLGLRDNFAEVDADIPICDAFNGTFSLFENIVEYFEMDYFNKEGFYNFEHILDKWCYENIAKNKK